MMMAEKRQERGIGVDRSTIMELPRSVFFSARLSYLPWSECLMAAKLYVHVVEAD